MYINIDNIFNVWVGSRTSYSFRVIKTFKCNFTNSLIVKSSRMFENRIVHRWSSETRFVFRMVLTNYSTLIRVTKEYWQSSIFKILKREWNQYKFILMTDIITFFLVPISSPPIVLLYNLDKRCAFRVKIWKTFHRKKKTKMVSRIKTFPSSGRRDRWCRNDFRTVGVWT